MNQAATRKAQTYSPHLEYLRFLRETIHARAKPFSIIIFRNALNSIRIFLLQKKYSKRKKKRAFHNNNNDR
tara:strand:+ start:1108 stop:1320 length:213 start_codon:yes stop_codon:yes gene_type:complete